MTRRGLLAFFLLLGACQRTPSAPAPAVADAGPATQAASAPVSAEASPAEPPAHVHAPVAPLAVCRAQGAAPLDAARRYYDEGQYEDALSCAAQAAALEPDLAAAHAERGVALAVL